MKHVVRIHAVAILCLLLTAVSAYAENSYLDFYSPQILGGGGETTSNEAPMGTVFNPAVSANRQRLTFDLSYMALTQLTPFEWGGNVVNMGVTWPTRVGVLSGIARFTNAGYDGTGLDWGTLGGLNVSFSKDLFDDLYVGAGLGFTYGGTATATDWGLGLDLGMLSLVGDLGFMKDFRWGVAVRNLGKAYQTGTTANSLGFAPAFTPAVGASFALVKTDLLRLSAAPDLSFPTFQDVRFKLGMEFVVADVFFVDAAYVFDLREVLGVEPSKTIPFQFGVSLNLSGLGVKTAGTEVTEVKSSVSATPLQSGVWGFGLGANVPIGMRDRTPPAITIDTQGEKYISPNFDGIKDDLVLPLSITDNRYIKEYVFIITDSSGAVVRTIQNKEDRPENRDVKNILARLAYVKTGIVIPESLRWDGRSDAGAVVADGSYAYHVEAKDDNGNLGKSPNGTVIVDNTPPDVKSVVDYLIFSPDGDGNKDTLPLQQSGSVEDAWTGTIRTVAGETVRTYTWQAGAPPVFEWDGKGNDDAAVPDGVYSYVITATDRAGNTGGAQVDNIIIDTKPTPVQLSIDLSFFSPNGDGVKDTVTFDPQVPVTTGIEKWSLVVTDEKGKPDRTFSGALTIPETIPWDGRDDAGSVLPEGAYLGTLTVVYVNGRNPKAASPTVAIDVTPPRAATKADYEVFSPNGDGNKDTVSIFQDTTEEMFWTGAMRTTAGKDMKTQVWRGRADDKWTWDGAGDDGVPLSDGAYAYILSSTDRAGNTGTSAPVTLRIDTGDTPVRVAADPQYFSPNGDGVKDKVRIIPSLRVAAGVDSWSFKVKDSSGSVVRSFTGRSKAPEEISWDGLDDGGKHTADGQYTAALEVVYVNGNKPKAETTPFFIDTRAPKIDVSADALLFSPTEDSKLTGVTIKQASSDEDLWEGEIRSADGKKVRGWFWKGKAADFTWDGKDDNGNLMPDGYYSYVVKAQSRAGTATAKELRGIQIDTRPTPVYVTAGSNGLSPNGDGFKDDVTFTMIVSMKEGVKSWKLAMVEAASGEQQASTGASPVPGTQRWDGKDKAGLKPAPDGLYTAVLTVEYHKGNVATAKSAPFRLAVTPPKVDLGLLGLPFSPDNDGVNDELTISLKVEDPVAIESWQISILDPESHPFTGFGGRGAPSDKIIWNGTSDTGEVVQSAEDYPLTFTIRDELGNSSVVKKLIPVDILVFRDGDKLKVRIASITFQANTADYVNVDIEKALKNGTTIKRLAEIFKKYSKYKIQIEGHANLVNWENAAKAKIEQEQELIPLSKKRADAIRDALIKEGIEASRITTVGVGASAPLVEFSDLDNRWKNRRVEFVLVRQ